MADRIELGWQRHRAMYTDLDDPDAYYYVAGLTHRHSDGRSTFFPLVPGQYQKTANELRQWGPRLSAHARLLPALGSDLLDWEYAYRNGSEDASTGLPKLLGLLRAAGRTTEAIEAAFTRGRLILSRDEPPPVTTREAAIAFCEALDISVTFPDELLPGMEATLRIEE